MEDEAPPSVPVSYACTLVSWAQYVTLAVTIKPCPTVRC